MSPLIEFCEERYVFSDYISEFGNSVSSLSYVFISFLTMLYGAKEYITKDIFLTGLGSFLFHAFPCIETEILDEGMILILVCDIIIALGGENHKFHTLSIYITGVTMRNFWVFYITLTVISTECICIMIQKYSPNSYVIEIIFFLFLGKICWFLEQYFEYCELHSLWHIFSSFALFYAAMISKK